jgi:signal-transduction protein with cAMP-binding, CBS, and nucleotidyltransferase domain
MRLITLWDLLSLPIRKRLTEHSPFFRGLRTWQIRKIVLVSKVQSYRRGDVIVHQGEPGDEMYVLMEGSAEVLMNRADGSRKHVRELVSGDVSGEIALVCLAQLDLAKHLLKDADAVEMALWFHDLIYDPCAPDKESKSAERFCV